jgi:hypothetical protein
MLQDGLLNNQEIIPNSKENYSYFMSLTNVFPNWFIFF